MFTAGRPLVAANSNTCLNVYYHWKKYENDNEGKFHFYTYRDIIEASSHGMIFHSLNHHTALLQ